MIIFIGIHYKEGSTALDSKTRSGKIIDCVISKVGLPCEKLNLFRTTYMPDWETQIRFVSEFISKANDENLYVLLGKEVNKHLSGKLKNSISVNHPAFYLRKGTDAINDFISELSKILIENAPCRKAQRIQP